MTLKLLSPLPRARTVAEEIEERLVLAIASGEQPAGSRLTEGSLAEAMEVSRVPAREALLSLAAKGLLVRAGARGLKVIGFAAPQVAQIRDVRIALESLAIRRAAGAVRQNPSAIASLDAVLEQMAAFATTDNALALAQCDLEFHRCILRLTENDVLCRHWEDLAPHLLVLFCKDWHRQSQGLGEVALHQNLRDFIVSGPLEETEAKLEAHFTTGT